MAGEPLASPSCGQRRLGQARDSGGVIGALQDHVEPADHHGQQVVEVMGHAASQPPHGFQALSLGEGGFGPGALEEALFQLARTFGHA